MILIKCSTQVKTIRYYYIDHGIKVIFHFKYKMVSLTIVFIGMVTQGGQDFTTLVVL